MSHLARIQEALTFSDNSSTLADITHLVLVAHSTDKTASTAESATFARESADKPLLSYAEYALFAQAIAPMANLQDELGWN